ncbi:MAG: S8 family serine peptidase [Myxococcota bacterium]
MSNLFAFFVLLNACTGISGGNDDPNAGEDSAIDSDDSGDPGTGDTVLTGDPDALAWGAIPDTDLADPDPAHVKADDALGMVDNRLALWLAKDAVIADVNGVLAPFSATIVGGDPELGWIVVEVDSSVLEDALNAALDAAAFEVAHLELIYPEQVLATAHGPSFFDDDSDYGEWEWETLDKGASWGLKFIHAPAAWNLRAKMVGAWEGGPMAVVLDLGFQDHIDLSFAEGSDLEARPETIHGTAVASVMTAHWNDTGMEGVFPSAPWLDESQWSTETLAVKSSTTIQNLQRLSEVLLTASLDEQPLVVNQSMGTNYLRRINGEFLLALPSDSPAWFGKSYAELNVLEGRALQAFSRRIADEMGMTQWLYVCSAGNSNIDDFIAELTGFDARRFTAAENSGCGYAASVGDPRFVAVENLQAPGDRLEHVSNRSGTIAAPGEQLGQADYDNGYRTGGGTSFSAPMVAGAAMVLWSLEPDATALQVREALLEGAREPVEDSAPILDLWAAIEHLDTFDEEPDLIRALADLDDGSGDGLLREDPDGNTVTETSRPDGDGCIDMADFRALRDAVLDGRLPDAAYDGLNGGERNIKRDYNEDGEIRWTASSAAAPDGFFARQDLDGDGVLGEGDVEVLGRVWGWCEDEADRADTAGLAANQLVGWLSSVDVWVDLTDAPSVTLTAEGVAPKTLRRGEDEVVGGYGLVTMPYDGCGDFVIRSTKNDVQRQWRPDDAAAPGNDLVLGSGAAITIDRTVPLAFRHVAGTGGAVALVYDSAEPAEVADPAIGMMVSSAGALALPDDSAIALATPARRWTIDIDGTIDDFTPWQWAPSGRALLAANVTTIDFDEDWFAYIDLDREQGWILDPDTPQHWGDWPAIDSSGVIWISGTDGHIHTISPPPIGIADVERFIDELVGLSEPICVDEVAEGIASPSAARFDQVTDWRELRLAHAEGGPVSVDGFVVAQGLNADETWDLVVLNRDGTEAVTIDKGWKTGKDGPDGEPHPESVSWSSSGRYLAYVRDDGVYVADMGDAWLNFPTDEAVSTTKISDIVGEVMFSPGLALLMVVDSFGPFSDPRADITVMTTDGTEMATYTHGPRYGQPGWSALGTQIVIIDPTDILTRPDLQVVSALRTEVEWETRDWRSETGGRSEEAFPTWARTLISD